ncbi:MAG: cytochrome P450 [Benniella sp.]|nr:MAG: cytochrome P450 [Benniella sp.]
MASTGIQNSQLVSLTRALVPLLTRTNLTKAFGAYVLYVLFKYRRSVPGTVPRTDLPGPWSIPLIGNLFQVLTLPRNQVLQRQTLNHSLYGPIYAMTIPGIGRVINISEPDMVDHVLRVNFWAYEKGPFLRSTLEPLVGGGIFGADGEHWKWQRKLASHIFNVKAFRNYTSTVFVEEAKLVMDYLSKKADAGEVVDLQELFYKYTLDSFGEIAFGQSFGCLNKPGDEVPFAVAFDRLNHELSERLMLPTWKIKDWWNGELNKLDKDVATVNEFAYRVIRDRREKGLERQDRKDLMQLFMETHDENGEPLTDEMLKDTLNNFILAGRDTTAQALSWTFYLMHRQQQADRRIVQKLSDETDTVLQRGDPTYESTKQQKYAEACFYEALRLYPSVPKNMKTCVEDDVLPGGHKVYKGERIAWSSWAMGRDTSIWGPDAGEYKPERWLKGEKPPQAKFVAFHVGPRTCLGQQFATIEAITIMSMLMQRFTFELVEPNKEPAYHPSLTLPMAHGLPVRIRHRVDA